MNDITFSVAADPITAFEVTMTIRTPQVITQIQCLVVAADFAQAAEVAQQHLPVPPDTHTKRVVSVRILDYPSFLARVPKAH